MGKSHKKKIAELSKEAENENSLRSTRSIDDENEETEHHVDSGAENGENNTSIRSAKKRKSASSKKVAKGKTPIKSKGAKKQKPDDSAISDQEYEVQSIVDHKQENGHSYFLIRWKGYSKEDDTWEREDTLSCSALIDKFKKQTANKSKARGSPKKSLKKSGEEEYEVEKIINYAEEKSGRLFLIRWKGYSAKDDTWEPEKNLHCDDMIEKFMQRMRQQENANFKELREEPKKTKRLVNETASRRHYSIPNGRVSKRASKKRIYYGDSDN